MRAISRQKARQWATVAAGVAVLCALPALVAALPVHTHALSAAQLRSRMVSSADVAYQGYAESYVNLDLPSLPNLSNVVALLDGNTEQYVWYRSPRQWRADELTTAGEGDTYQTRHGMYLWNYTLDQLTKVVGSQPVRLPRAADLLPPQLAQRLLSFASRAARFSLLPAQRVAGIDAAGLRIVPADPASTITAVDMWADPVSGLPVAVEVLARGEPGPVLVSRFLSLSLKRPAEATLRPQPGPGIHFATTALPDAAGVLNGFGPPLPGSLGWIRRVANPTGLADLAAYGSGFSRFAVVPLPSRAGAAVLSAASSAGVTITIAQGTAVVVETPLINMLLVRSPLGPVYLLTGAVTVPRLEYAAVNLLESQ